MSDERKHQIRKIDFSGDTKTIWDPDNEDEVAAARRTFDELKGKGYAAFSVKGDGEKNESLEEFDPEEGKIIMVPPIRGG